MPEILGALQDGLTAISPTGLFIALFFAAFVSEDAACVIAGTAAASGHTSYILAILACLSGIVAGDLLLYGIGSLLGNSILENRIAARFISIESKQKAGIWLTKNAAKAVFLSRVISGLRLPTYLAAGAMRAGFCKFALYFLVAAAIWTPIIVITAGLSQSYIFNGNVLWATLAVIVAIRLALRSVTWKNRRLLVGRLSRLYHWEFWPMPVFYLPVVAYVLFLAAKFRSLTLFTAANPCLPAGGFVGESKDQIYRTLGASPAAAPYLLKYRLIKGNSDPSERSKAVESFMVDEGLSFPIIIKPDVGERGTGVSVIGERSDLLRKIESAQADVIAQEFCPGVEASVFYFRSPNEECGEIFSITEKTFPYVTGDGRSTLERLILQDKRAVCVAQQYLDRNRDRLGETPAKGEQVSLVDIGTHSRGAIFSDGEGLRSPELERTVDAICKGVEGFYFGRFDIRSESFTKMSAGDFKIIELNGVTSESTNIYDLRYSLIDAYRILFAQWKIAFMIGSENVKSGVRPASLRQFARLILTRDATRISPIDSGVNITAATTKKACA